MARGIFVGRSAESERLDALQAGASSGHPATVLVGGEAGVGKTKLLDEFEKRARDGGAEVLKGRCIDLDTGAIPYGPLIEALRQLVRARGEQGAARFAGPVWETLRGLVAEFTGRAPASSGGPGSQLRTFGAVSRLLDHVGKTRPVVVVFEDIQWADHSTLDLIAHLARNATNERMMLACSYRTGLDREHPLRVRLAEPEFTRRIERITLPRLAKPDLRAFVRARADKAISAERVERYVELADGNPYFAEQLAAADDPTRPEPLVPESITDFMRMRLDQLDPDASRVARVAAVARRRVSDQLLAAVVDLDEPTFDRALRTCLDRRILIDNETEETYEFEHALLRETAYHQVFPRERKRLHAVIAAAIEPEVAQRPDLIIELAYHWTAAGKRPEALAASVRAGRLAFAVRAFQEAETHYTTALNLWSTVPDAAERAGLSRVELLQTVAEAARWASHVDRAVRWARQAIDEVDADAEPESAGEAHERLGSYLWDAGDLVASVAELQEARRLLADARESPVRSRVLATLAAEAVRRGHPDDGYTLGREAVEEAQAAGARAEEGRAMNSVGLALTMRGELDEGLAWLREARQIAVESELIEDMLRAYGNLGVCLVEAGRLTEAVTEMTEGLAAARRLGVPHTRRSAVLANNAGEALFLLGRWEEASGLLDEVLEHLPAGETLFQRLTKAQIAVGTGRVEEAKELLDDVRSRPSSDPRFLAPLYVCLAELCLWQGEPALAREAVEHGIDAVSPEENAVGVLQLCAVGLWAAADSAPDHTDGTVEDPSWTELEKWAATLGAAYRDATERTTHPGEVKALNLLCAAEEHRLHGKDSGQTWTEVAAAWAELGRPYPRAYALGRAVEASVRAGLTSAAKAAAQDADSLATEIGAAPLRKRILDLSRRHRLRLARTREDDRTLGLTPMELVVAGEVRGGHSNRDIAARLYLSQRTIAVHLSNMYRKVEVHNRMQLIAKLRDAGFFDN